MADEEEQLDGAEPADALEELGIEDDEEPKKGGKKKLIILVLLLLIVGGGVAGGLFYFGIIGGSDENAEALLEGVDEQGRPLDSDGNLIDFGPIFYELDEFIINLNTGGKQVKFLKMKIILEVTDQDAVTSVETFLPRIRDSFQIYLRELRAEDLQGSAGIYRLKTELLLRVNKLMYPTKVDNILFKDVLIQ